MKLCRPRNANPKELLEIALCCSKGGPDLETIRGHLEGAAVAAFDHYTTDSPGYQGTVYAVIWPGGPEIVQSFIRHPGNYIIEANDTAPADPAFDAPLRGKPKVDALDTAELVEHLEGSGLNVHVIDENTDFSKLPPLK